MKALFTFFILVFISSFIYSQDLMRNGGFENPDHFEFWTSSVTVTGASVQPVNTTAQSGSWSVEIKSGTSPIGGWTQLMQTLLAPANNIDYRLTLWVKDSVTTSNFLGVYGLTTTGEVALGIDSLNNTAITDPDSGRIIITQAFFQNWTRINYFFNSGQDYTGYLLKFEEATEGNSLTLHMDNFAILPVPGQATVQVTSPNGGENWSVNSQQNVTWTSTNVTNVKIDYSTNNGGVWLNVVSSVPAASGSYSWTIPNTPSTQCLVRVSDASLASRFDVSDNVFTILPLVTVTTPNGGENWLANSQQNITWTSQIITNVSIEYSTNNGTNWISVIASTPASSGSYNWTVPYTPSTQCLVRISDASNPSINDVSDNIFTIVPLVTVTSPNGGENWLGNSQRNITWTSQNITNVSIEYSTNNGTNWINVIASTPASGGNYSWTVPNTPSTQCLVRISDASNVSFNDVSNATFTITAAPIPTVTVTVPNGGEIWVAGTNHNVTWTRVAVAQIKIEYSTDNGSAWIDVVASVPSIVGSYNWTIPNTPSTQCLVRISDTSNPSVNDVSDNTFTIEGGVSVEYLNSGIPEEYNLYQSYPNPFNPSTMIEFSLPEEVANVKLSIYNALGEKVAELVNTSLAAGSYRYQWNAENLATGMYIYELRTDNFVSIKKMLLMK
ncbi:MAG: T9SS type A sorting domain-containing protein [Ignavibacteriaceae bacterium]|nr:T9SS type A sorting domain-containing protein [Ignavibacteriaceae bacterium]